MAAPAPRLLAEPRILHDGEGWVLWHSGIVDGPNGVQGVVEVLDTSGSDRIGGTDWDLAVPAGVLTVALTGDVAAQPVHVAEKSTPRSFRVSFDFGVREPGGCGEVRLHIAVVPLAISTDVVLPQR
jgi:hypothetical protein